MRTHSFTRPVPFCVIWNWYTILTFSFIRLLPVLFNPQILFFGFLTGQISEPTLVEFGLRVPSLKRRGAALPLLPLPAPSWLWAWAAPKNPERLRAERSKTARQEDVQIDETDFHEHHRSAAGAQQRSLTCLSFTHTDTPARCPSLHLAASSGPLYGWHLWLPLRCSWCFLLRTLPLLPRTRDLPSAASGRASWRGRWFSWMSTLAARSESWTTTSFRCSWILP